MFGSIGDGKRSSSATAYLSADVVARANLDVLVTNQVTKLINTATGSTPAFTGVQFAPSADGKFQTSRFWNDDNNVGEQPRASLLPQGRRSSCQQVLSVHLKS